VYVFIDHAVDGEMPFNMATTGCAVNLFNTCNRLNGLVHVAHQKPFWPFSISSGMLPLSKAITGVPQAMDSITDRPKGSSNCMGCNSAQALPSSRLRSTGPTLPI
jgi:hypothetical protein